jgi:L-cysteine:1D-myo-inositol 2-amino-2-deoxy-alpha-D-glucopyranoside ligase
VFFDIARSESFGSLSKYPAELRYHYARERGGQPDDPRKRNPLDFILWRPARDGEPSYGSPFGPGIPGWHIGCSTMARGLLGATVDLHGGGADLVHPHHECELAQTMTLQTEPFARVWHHCEFVRYQGKKMSKFLGNIVFIRDLLKEQAPGAIRLACSGSTATARAWSGEIATSTSATGCTSWSARRHRPVAAPTRHHAHRFRAALDDDLDVPPPSPRLKSFPGRCSPVATIQGHRLPWSNSAGCSASTRPQQTSHDRLLRRWAV